MGCPHQEKIILCLSWLQARKRNMSRAPASPLKRHFEVKFFKN
jgi:hypothetical protein